MKDWLWGGTRHMCVGYYKQGEESMFVIYNAENGECDVLTESAVIDMLQGGSPVLNLYYHECLGTVNYIYGEREKLNVHKRTIVGMVTKVMQSYSVLGYDTVQYNDATRDTVHEYVDMHRAREIAREEGINNIQYSDNDEESDLGVYLYQVPLYARYAESEGEELERLKAQFVDVLTQMNKIRPVQFHDVDCEDCLYNFSNVVIDEKDNRVYIEIAMRHDNLPAHADNPLRDGRGRAILSEEKDVSRMDKNAYKEMPYKEVFYTLSREQKVECSFLCEGDDKFMQSLVQDGYDGWLKTVSEDKIAWMKSSSLTSVYETGLIWSTATQCYYGICTFNRGNGKYAVEVMLKDIKTVDQYGGNH